MRVLCLGHCFTSIVILSVLSSFEIILLKKIELVECLYLCSCCCVTVCGLVSVSCGTVGVKHFLAILF